MNRLDINPQALVSARKQAGMTQEQVAVHLGFKGKAAISNWETGFSKPSAGLLFELAYLYGVQAETLLEKSTKTLCHSA